ncbi:MAG: hypothetical protein ACR2RV_15160 [Verrucomicrobiales bacterium]
MEEEYLVLACPACERDVKVSRDSAGVRMGCPYCREPLQIIEAEQEEAKPIIRQPLVFRLLRRDDLSSDHDLEFADEYERRRLPFEAPEWDDEKVEEKRREGAGVGDSDLAGSDGKDPARGKKLLTRKEQVFRSITILIMTSALAFVAVIVYSAIVRGLAVVNTDRKTVKELPAEVRQKIDEALAQEEPQSKFLTSAEEAAAAAIVDGFLAAKTVEDRLPFVRQPERVEPLMRTWYARDGVVTDWPDGTVLLRDKQVDDGRYMIRLAIEFVGIGTRIFIVEETPDSFKLDWETAVGYQAQPFAEFKAERPIKPVEFRVKMKPTDYYNYTFSSRDRYRAVELSYPGQSEFKLTGYIDLSHDWAAPLIQRLDSGEAPSVIVKLRYPSGEPEDESQVEVVELVAKSWYR